MDNHLLWKSVLAELELSVSKAIYQVHFANTQLLDIKDDVATIGIPNPLLRSLIETRYYSLLKSIIDGHTKKNISLVFAVTPKKESMRPDNSGPLFTDWQADTKKNIADLAKKLHILPELTFETFAVSSTNQIAYAAATAVAKNPGTAYNPLFIYGGVGVGKTHLMHAVANVVLNKKPGTRVVYCMGEEFLNEIIEAIQTKSARLFKQKYRSAKLLMVDDVQFIAGKQTAQEEFFHTFNAVHREGGQVILTSDRHPSEISRLEDRLRSRFEGGLIVDVSQPDFELRTAIVNIKSQAIGLTLPDEVAKTIAANTTDARAIEGFLRRLSTEVVAARHDIDADLVRSLLQKRPGQINHSEPTAVRKTPQEVLDAVSIHYGLKASALKGSKRNRPIARPRQLVMYLCKTELGMTLSDIGGLLGGRDHTTVMHGVETITQELSADSTLREDVSGIKKRLWG